MSLAKKCLKVYRQLNQGFVEQRLSIYKFCRVPINKRTDTCNLTIINIVLVKSKAHTLVQSIAFANMITRK